MARKTVVLLCDDLDGGPADETVTFALGGIGYEIDLRGDNAGRLRALFAPYVGAGRRVGGRSTPARPSPAGTRPRVGGPARTDPAQLAAIRAWARARGIQVRDRDRIPAHIIEQYHNPTAAAASPTPPASAAAAPAAMDPAGPVVPTVTFTAPAPPPRRTRRS